MLILPLSLYAEITRKGGNPKIRTYEKVDRCLIWAQIYTA